jgi:type IV secretory pathway VirJ component
MRSRRSADDAHRERIHRATTPQRRKSRERSLVDADRDDARHPDQGIPMRIARVAGRLHVIDRRTALVLATSIVASFAIASTCVAVETDAAPASTPTSAPAHHATKHKKKGPPPHDPKADRYLNVGGFGEVALYRPGGNARGLALFASGDGGWSLGVLDMAHEAADAGYWVAGFSTPTYLKALDAGDADCSDDDGVLAKLAEQLVREADLPADTKPIVIGYSSGATIAYAALAADDGARFGGGISLGFCPDLLMRKPFCAGTGGLTQQKQQVPPYGYVFDKLETVKVPWRILQGDADKVCDPAFAPDFAEGQTDSKAVILPKVGHGFSAPGNWMPQYRDALREVRDAAAK